MKTKLNLELAVDFLVVILTLLALALVVASAMQFSDTKAVYGGF